MGETCRRPHHKCFDGHVIIDKRTLSIAIHASVASLTAHPHICILHSEELVLFVKYNYYDQMKEEERGTACSKHGGEEEWK
jgi:hypothetical protein